MVSSDSNGTEPAAGLMVNSTGWCGAPHPSHFFRNKSDTCWVALTLGVPDPSSKTRRAKFMGTKDVLESVHVTVAGKPGKDKQESGVKHKANEKNGSLFEWNEPHQRLRLQNSAQEHQNEMWDQWYYPYKKINNRTAQHDASSFMIQKSIWTTYDGRHLPSKHKLQLHLKVKAGGRGCPATVSSSSSENAPNVWLWKTTSTAWQAPGRTTPPSGLKEKRWPSVAPLLNLKGASIGPSLDSFTWKI